MPEYRAAGLPHPRKGYERTQKGDAQQITGNAALR
jgi:hypothetical protein